MKLLEAMALLAATPTAYGIVNGDSERVININMNNEFVEVYLDEDGFVNEGFDDVHITLNDLNADWGLVFKPTPVVTTEKVFSDAWNKVATSFRTVKKFEESVLAKQLYNELKDKMVV